MTNQVYLLQEKIEVVQTLDASLQEPYAESISSYNNEKARETLRKFGNFNGDLTGSNPFMILQLIRAGLLPKHIDHIATRQDLENAIERNSDFLKKTYVDFGLALKTAGDSYNPNDLLAETLAEQLSTRGVELGKGKLIPFSVLTINENKNSAYGLVFELNDLATKETILDLDQFIWDWTRNEGLSRVCLYDAQGWVRDLVHLAGSDTDGRVVGVGVADAKNLGLKYSDESVRKALKETGFLEATEPILTYLQQHS